MSDDRVDIKRSRRHSKASSNSSHGRRRVTEKLVDASRRVGMVGRATVDNGARISPGLANYVQLKACQLEIRLSNEDTGDFSDPCWVQAGLIQAEQLTVTPPERPQKKRAVQSTSGNATAQHSILRCSRFAVVPITCIRNLEDENSDGETWKYSFSVLRLVNHQNANISPVFDKASYIPDPSESVVVRQGDDARSTITWDYYDVTTAQKITNPRSNLTLKTVCFQKMQRAGFEFRVGQKVGMTVYRNFELTCEDAGAPEGSITEEELRQIYGQEGRVNIYTGQITNVSPDGNAFEHDINTFRGCSGAVMFLLDIDQEGVGVDTTDYGKAIAIHVGGDEADGIITNIAFKIQVSVGSTETSNEGETGRECGKS